MLGRTLGNFLEIGLRDIAGYERKIRDAPSRVHVHYAPMIVVTPDNGRIATLLDEDALWRIVQSKSRAYDGRFLFGVMTTRIYCRPTCPARAPRRENVRFFASAAEAQAAGLRACKRCVPDSFSREEEAIAKALQLIGKADGAVPLSELAEAADYTPSHFQRLFKRAVGLSPAAYARALRIERAGMRLSDGESVTGSIYEAGYASPSRFYEASQGRMGMAPSAWAAGGKGVTIRWAVVPTTLGRMLVAATDKGVCRLSFNEDGDDLAARFPNAELVEGGASFAALLENVIAAVEQPGQSRSIPLDVQGTAFQEAVWKELRKIPAGETRSYGEIAAAIGKPGAVRAAGSANGANPVAVLVPCHRVVRSDGSLGGYAYGEEIKRELLKREKG